MAKRSALKRAPIHSRSERIASAPLASECAEELRQARSRIDELERELSASREQMKEVSAERRGLAETLERLERSGFPAERVLQCASGYFAGKRAFCTVGAHTVSLSFDEQEDPGLLRAWAAAVGAASHGVSRMVSLAMAGQRFDYEAEDERLLANAVHGMDFLSCFADRLTRAALGDADGAP